MGTTNGTTGRQGALGLGFWGALELGLVYRVEGVGDLGFGERL
jgi:hypothetical protein